MSFADGGEGETTGRLLFYLTTFDASAQDAAANASASLTLCELQLPGACQGKDPQARTLAHERLCRAEHGRLPMRSLRKGVAVG